MPYSDNDHDRALARLQADLDRLDATTPPRNAEAGVGVALALLCLIVALWLLLAVGCVSTPRYIGEHDGDTPTLARTDR